MAMKIVDTCISCAACESECPNQAISDGDPIFLVDAQKCTECVGAFDAPKCVEVCPVEGAIINDPDLVESKDALLAKYQQLHA
jgi:ferredoxin